MVFDPSDERNRLIKALDGRAKAVKEADDWFEGRHPIPTPPPNTAADPGPTSRERPCLYADTPLLACSLRPLGGVEWPHSARSATARRRVD